MDWTLRALSMMSCNSFKVSLHSWVSDSNGLMCGEPSIVWAFTMWSSRSICSSSIPPNLYVLEPSCAEMANSIPAHSAFIFSNIFSSLYSFVAPSLMISNCSLCVSRSMSKNLLSVVSSSGFS